MPSIGRPLNTFQWTDGGATKVAQPTPSQVASGYTAGQRPAYQTVNYNLWAISQWLAYLDSTANANAMTAALEPLIRLLGGGQWSWSTSTGLLSWSAPITLGVPGLADSANTIAAGSITLSTGQVAVVNANIPFTATATTTSGSTQLTNLSYELGISVGQSASGNGIPSGTTVAAVTSSSVTLSQAATATASGVSVTFVGNATLSPTSVAHSQLAPSPNTVIFARSTGATCIVGVNAGQFVLRDNEVRLLDGLGYLAVASGTAGQPLTPRVPVYVSPGSGDSVITQGTYASGATTATVSSATGVYPGMAVAGSGIASGTTVASLSGTTLTLSAATTAAGSSVVLTLTRVAGQLYAADASSTYGSVRAQVLGLATSTVATGASCGVATGGLVAGFTGLTAGSTYYVDPANPGAVTAIKPSVTNQWLAPLGVAVNATTLALTPDSATQVTSLNPWPQYQVQSQADLQSATAACSTAGGGVIVLSASITLSAAVTLGTGTLLQGRKGAAVITVSSGGSLTLSDQSELRDLYMASATGNSGTLVAASASACIVRGCRFSQPSGSTGTCISVRGQSNRFYNNVFAGVSGTTATGIAYLSGSGNLDDSSVFTG